MICPRSKDSACLIGRMQKDRVVLDRTLKIGLLADFLEEVGQGNIVEGHADFAIDFGMRGSRGGILRRSVGETQDEVDALFFGIELPAFPGEELEDSGDVRFVKIHADGNGV